MFRNRLYRAALAFCHQVFPGTYQASEVEEDEVVNGHFVTLALDCLGGQFWIEEKVCCVDAVGDWGLSRHCWHRNLAIYCRKSLRRLDVVGRGRCCKCRPGFQGQRASSRAERTSDAPAGGCHQFALRLGPNIFLMARDVCVLWQGCEKSMDCFLMIAGDCLFAHWPYSARNV